MGIVEEEKQQQPPPAEITKKSNYTSKNSCYETFLYSMSAEDTKRRYSKNLREFLNFCKFETYEQLLEITDDEKFEAIRDFLISLTETRKLSYASVNISYFAIKLFYDVNKVVLNWKNLSRYKGKFARKVEDRLYTKEELKTLLEHADLRERVIVMTLLSTGMRVGGLASITLENMQYLEEYKLYKFTVYADDSNWKYVTFCTPETAVTIQAYLNHRVKYGGEELTKKSPLLVQKINASNFIKIGAMDSNLIQQTMTRLQYRSTVTEKETADTATERGRIRKEFMRCHAMRKMFNSTCIENNVNHYVKEMLMGHKKNLGLDINYFRPKQNQLLTEYLKIVDDLTINNEYRLEKQVQQLEEKNQDTEYVIKGKLQEMMEKNQEKDLLIEKMTKEMHIVHGKIETFSKSFQEVDQSIRNTIESRLNTKLKEMKTQQLKQQSTMKMLLDSINQSPKTKTKTK